MHNPVTPRTQQSLAHQVRQQFVAALSASLADIDKAVLEFLTALMGQTGTQREMQSRRDAWQLYGQHRAEWVSATQRALQQALGPQASASRSASLSGASLELLSDDVVENKIVASRMALTVLEAVSTHFDALRLRVQRLEGQELGRNDILRPETLSLLLVERWVEVGLPRANLQTVIDPLQRALAERVQAAYQACNDFLGGQGVAPQDVRLRVSRPLGAPQARERYRAVWFRRRWSSPRERCLPPVVWGLSLRWARSALMRPQRRGLQRAWHRCLP